MNDLDNIAGGQVTIADLYRALTDLNKNVSTVLTKMEVVELKNTTQQQRTDDHETRLRTAESFIQELKGKAAATRNVAATIGALVGLASGIISAIIAHIH